MQRIQIKGGKIYITESSQLKYIVEKGHVLVYLLPYDGQRMGRRLYLYEAVEGESIPGFVSVGNGQSMGWRIALVALDQADIVMDIGYLEDALEFAGKIGIHAENWQEFSDELIEKYEMNATSEEGYIYATKTELENTKYKSLKVIYDVFGLDGMQEGYEESGEEEYDAVAFVCRQEKINIAPLQEIKNCCGRKYNIQDIARISHFTVREVILEEDWFKKDCGSFVAYNEEKEAIACVSKGTGRYLAKESGRNQLQRIDAKYASQLNPKAYMLYRPFPNKKIYVKDLVKFGLQMVKAKDVVRLLFLALLGVLIGLLLPFLNEKVYDGFIPMGDSQGLFQLGMVILACSLGNISFTVIKNFASFRSVNTMKYAVQSATIDRLFNLPESFFREYDVADLGNRAMGLATIFDILGQSAITTVLSAVFSLMYVWRMNSYSKLLTKYAFVMLLVESVFLLWLGIRQTQLERKKMDVDKGAQSVIFQYLSGISKVRVSAAEDRALLQYLRLFVDSRKINIKKEKTTVWVNTLVSAAQVLFSIIFYYLMVKKNLNLSLGAFSAFSSAFGAFYGALTQLIQNFLIVNQCKPIYELSKPILQTLPETLEGAMLPEQINGDIEIDHVTFSYNEGEGQVLRGINLHFKPGEYIGIVGPSGCGKSTLMKLLLGFEKPQTGKIYYDGNDIDETDKRELRKKFGVVLQNGGLISGSIYDNITITAPRCKMERVEEVIREVGLEGDINDMPMGIHTIVSENSGTISGGQAQRILLARALVGKPKVIFLDEATSALDNVTQSMVVQALEKIKATKIVIAHRLSTIINCDRIIVMRDGEVVEEGDFKSLMDKKGLFYELAIRQMAENQNTENVG